MLNKLATSAGSVEKAKKTYWNWNWTSLQQAFQKDIDEIIVHYKPKLKNHQLKQLERF